MLTVPPCSMLFALAAYWKRGTMNRNQTRVVFRFESPLGHQYQPGTGIALASMHNGDQGTNCRNTAVRTSNRGEWRAGGHAENRHRRFGLDGARALPCLAE